MGLFSKIVGTGKAYPSSEPEAVLGLLLAVIAADGDISSDEKDAFMYLANKTKSLGPMPADTFWAHVDTCTSVLRREGAVALMERCVPAVTPERRRAVFLNCCDLIMRDGRVEPEEEALVEALQERLAIDAAFASASVDVILTKYSL